MWFNDYVKCLFDGKDVDRNQMTFKSDSHQVNTIETNKIALNSIDDKRFVCDNQIDTLAHAQLN